MRGAYIWLQSDVKHVRIQNHRSLYHLALLVSLNPKTQTTFGCPSLLQNSLADRGSAVFLPETASVSRMKANLQHDLDTNWFLVTPTSKFGA